MASLGVGIAVSAAFADSGARLGFEAHPTWVWFLADKTPKGPYGTKPEGPSSTVSGGGVNFRLSAGMGSAPLSLFTELTYLPAAGVGHMEQAVGGDYRKSAFAAYRVGISGRVLSAHVSRLDYNILALGNPTYSKEIRAWAAGGRAVFQGQFGEGPLGWNFGTGVDVPFDMGVALAVSFFAGLSLGL